MLHALSFLRLGLPDRALSDDPNGDAALRRGRLRAMRPCAGDLSGKVISLKRSSTSRGDRMSRIISRRVHSNASPAASRSAVKSTVEPRGRSSK